MTTETKNTEQLRTLIIDSCVRNNVPEDIKDSIVEAGMQNFKMSDFDGMSVIPLGNNFTIKEFVLEQYNANAPKQKHTSPQEKILNQLEKLCTSN